MTIPKEVLDALMKDYKNPEDLIGETGLLKQLTKQLTNKEQHMKSIANEGTLSISVYENFDIFNLTESVTALTPAGLLQDWAHNAGLEPFTDTDLDGGEIWVSVSVLIPASLEQDVINAVGGRELLDIEVVED